ncbi:MAG: DNA-binding protein [Thermoplasmatota archaeon]
MDDLEAARKRRLEELRAQAARTNRPAAPDSAGQAAQEQAEQEAMERLLQQVLEPEARERLTLIRMSRPDYAEAVGKQLVALAQQGRLARRLTDADLRQLLAQLTSADRDIKITRK